jgi:hypothetical protein
LARLMAFAEGILTSKNVQFFFNPRLTAGQHF